MENPFAGIGVKFNFFVHQVGMLDPFFQSLFSFVFIVISLNSKRKEQTLSLNSIHKKLIKYSSF